MLKAKCMSCGSIWEDGIAYCPDCGNTDFTLIETEDIPYEEEEEEMRCD